MFLLKKLIISFVLLFVSITIPLGSALADNNYELQALIKDCELQNASACERLGSFFYFGTDVSTDYKKAIKFYKKGCKLKNKESCAGLGNLFSQEGVMQNRKQAIKYYDIGCELQDSYSCFILGGAFYFGIGLSQKTDYPKAIKYLT